MQKSEPIEALAVCPKGTNPIDAGSTLPISFCEKCNKIGKNSIGELKGFAFQRHYEPEEFIEGNPDSKIWIVSLNPFAGKASENYLEPGAVSMNDDHRTKLSLLTHYDHFKNWQEDPKAAFRKPWQYYRSWKAASSLVIDGLLNGTVAHLDIVKCYSETWPPKFSNSNQVVENCQIYFRNQLSNSNVRILICAGRAVHEAIKSICSPPSSLGTVNKNPVTYVSKVNGRDITIILTPHMTGHRGLTNQERREVGLEIEKQAEICGVPL